MPWRRSNILQVVVLALDTHTLLCRCRSFIRPLLLTQERIYKLVHASIGKKQRRIILYRQWRAGHDGMAHLLKKVQERFTYFIALDRFHLLSKFRKSLKLLRFYGSVIGLSTSRQQGAVPNGQRASLLASYRGHCAMSCK